MCGITGIFNLDFQSIDFNVLKRMSDVQKHRGPDDQGFVGFSFNRNTVSSIDINSQDINSNSFHGGIGFNRLSILDLSINGHQPMISNNGKVVIAYNGETYNAFEFKDQLKKKGYQFRSQTDTEVLLHLYQEYGINKLLELVNGMFAFCIVDLKLERLFLARDHVGIKPIYWYRKGKTLLFASEIKSFIPHPGFHAEIAEEHVDEYFFYKYNAHDRTVFKNVNQLPPGYYLEASLSGEKLKKYWEPNLTTKNTLSEMEAGSRLEEILKSSVKSQLISDVKVGCQLSGGIDSSLITTFAREYFDANMDTFSVIPENKAFSEEKYIDQVIEKTNSNAHKLTLTPEWFSDNIISAAWHSDVPLPLAQTVGMKRLAEGASDFVTVLLSGEGSDELMGGYTEIYCQAYKMKNKHLINCMSKIPGKGEKIKKQYLPHISNEDYFIQSRSTINLEDYLSFRPDNEMETVFNQRKKLYPDNADLLKKVRYYDMKGWLVNLLNHQDKMTMAHSIENRVPFLDKKMIDFVFSLPSDFFVRSSRNPLKYNSPNYYTKILLKTMTKRFYNHDFVYRNKMGFNQPLQDYFNHPLLKEMINDSILPGIKKRGIISYKQISQLWAKGYDNIDHSGLSFLWSCVSFELWAQLFIDKRLGI